MSNTYIAEAYRKLEAKRSRIARKIDALRTKAEDLTPTDKERWYFLIQQRNAVELQLMGLAQRW